MGVFQPTEAIPAKKPSAPEEGARTPQWIRSGGTRREVWQGAETAEPGCPGSVT